MADSHWRLIPDYRASGRTQMAIDQWLLAQHLQGLQPHCLRFYTWTPATISLGYHQKRWPLRWQTIEFQGARLEIVRRPTGGRAVLHQGDVTYSVVSSGFVGKRLAVYRQICRFLIQGWRSLGVPLHYGQQQRGYEKSPNCFASPTVADLITPQGEKLIGSAQLRRQLKRKRAVLQHGSMRLRPDRDLHSAVFSAPFSAPALPRSLQDLSFERCRSQVIEALAEAAQTCFGQSWTVQPLSNQEIDAAIAQFGHCSFLDFGDRQVPLHL
ncbi:MAG: lipoate--protein ligase family protein [Cyanobacteria bacterium P01_C01_bin.73]